MGPFPHGRLLEDVSHPSEEGFVGVLPLGAVEGPKLLDKLLLLGGQAFGDVDLQTGDQIASAVPPGLGHAPAPDPQFRPDRRPCRDTEAGRAVQPLHLHLHPQHKLRVVERQIPVEVRALPLEEGVGLLPDHDVQVSGRAALVPRLPFARQADPGVLAHTGWDADGDRRLDPAASLAVALVARSLDDLSPTAAVRAGTGRHDLAKGGLSAGRDRPLPPAPGTGLNGSAGLGAAAVTPGTLGHPPDPDLFLDPLEALFQGEDHLHLEIGAPDRPPGLALAAAHAAEKGVKDVAQVSEILIATKTAGRGSPARKARTAGAGPAKGVILASFVRIRQDGVGLADLLEAFLGLGIALVLVGVVLPRQTPVGFFDLVVRRASGDAQDLVVVFQRSPSCRSFMPSVTDRW